MKIQNSLALIFFCGLGCIQTATVFSFGNQDTIYDNDNYLVAKYQYELDLEYHTEYYSGLYTGPDAPYSGYQYQLYQIFLQSTARGILDLKILNWYSYKIDLKFKPFKISPFGQWIIYMRPETGMPFDINLYASTWVEIGNLTTHITENTRTCYTSVYDYIDDSTTNSPYPDSITDDCPFNELYQTNYFDPYWTFDLGSIIFPDSFKKAFYGEKRIYSWWILGNYDW
ncbi:UNKNOWN [Stylonychia lemnae]|uniref:Uncharacterized protein n=1 Tax=Stylonychia lemnae TaxID=5949 RepID=A0A078B7K1_STYLE|nr:UNKNOWN [Stylonychia lemnae]|eukprot:CDW90480.1 UNKNOWN [Stylonychia lemnae]